MLKIIKIRRCRNYNRRKRKWLNTTQKLGIIMDITPLFNDNTSEPLHVLIQLSRRQWKRFYPNGIHLTGKHKHVYYKGIDYGSNIKSNLRHEKVYDEADKWN